MAKLRSERIGLILVGALTAIVLAIAFSIAIGDRITHRVVVAAGPGNSESAALLRAVRSVVERHYPNIRITVAETSDTADSLRRLEHGEAQFAASQADAATGPSARLVAVLFEDAFQVLAHKSEEIRQFTDLKGKRIALPVKDSQYQSFLFVAAHYGLAPEDFTFIGADAESASLSFVHPKQSGSGYYADAVFRVRPIIRSALERGADPSDLDLVPISHTQALHIEMPAYTPAVIPKGMYSGNPPVPSRDIETVASKHTLLARDDTAEDVVGAITQVLMERRPELGAYLQVKDPSVLPLLAQIERPVVSMALGLGVHPGAQAVYAGGRMPWIQRHSDLLLLVVILSAVGVLWTWALRRIQKTRRHQRLTAYTTRIAALIQEVESSTSDAALTAARRELMEYLPAAMADLRRQELPENSFQTFYFAWQFALASVRERKAALRRQSGAPQGDDETVPAPVIPAAERPLWRFARLLQPKSTP